MKNINVTNTLSSRAYYKLLENSGPRKRTINPWNIESPNMTKKRRLLERGELKIINAIRSMARVFWVASLVLICIASLSYTKSAWAFFNEKPKVIGCINTLTYETFKPNKKGNCLTFGPNIQNIMLPPKSHIKIWKKVYNESEAINRLPIVNFESGFNPKANNKYAIGYVQTLRKWNVSTEIKTQLEWMKTRQDYQKQTHINGVNWVVEACGIYKYKDNVRDGYLKGEEGVMACLYRWHYHAHNGTWYARKAMSAREYYITYFKTHKFY